MVSWLNEITAEQVGAGTTSRFTSPFRRRWGGTASRPTAAGPEAGLIEMIRPPWNKMGVEQMKRWQRVSMGASAEDGITIIRITRGRKGDAMATVESLE